MKKVLCILAVAVLSFSGCSTMVKKPAVHSLKRIAIISVYCNADVHNVKASTDSTAKISILKGMLGAKTDKSLEGNEIVRIATYGLLEYGKQLDSIPNWTVIPPRKVLASKKYKSLMRQSKTNKKMGAFLRALQKAAEVQWVTPPGMPYIPVSSVSHGSGKTVIIKGRKDPVEYAREKLAELCKELNVDGVAIIGLDLAYKKGMLSGMSGTGLLKNIRGKATPMVASEIVIVTKNAEIAVESNLLSKGGGKYSKANSAPMMLKGRPNLKDSKGKSIKAYNVAVKKSAEELRKAIMKGLSK